MTIGTPRQSRWRWRRRARREDVRNGDAGNDGSRIGESRIGESRIGDSRNGDAGETLLELLIAIAIIGIGAVTILGAVAIAVSSSTLDQRQVQAQSRLKSWAETLSAGTYRDCAGPSGANSYPLPSLPSGFHASYQAVQFWDGSGFRDTLASCAAAGASDQGVQRLHLQITADATLYPGTAADLWVTLRKPCTTAGAC